MNIYNKNWAQYEYSYNLANSRENWAPPPPKIAPRGWLHRGSDGPLEVAVVYASGPMTSDEGLPTGLEMVGSPARAVGDGIAPRDMPT